jgi:hypothetical protein
MDTTSISSFGSAHHYVANAPGQKKSPPFGERLSASV